MGHRSSVSFNSSFVTFRDRLPSLIFHHAIHERVTLRKKAITPRMRRTLDSSKHASLLRVVFIAKTSFLLI